MGAEQNDTIFRDVRKKQVVLGRSWQMQWSRSKIIVISEVDEQREWQIMKLTVGKVISEKHLTFSHTVGYLFNTYERPLKDFKY